MVRQRNTYAALLAIAVGSLGCSQEPTGSASESIRSDSFSVHLEAIGTYATDIFDDGGAEIVAHDADTQRLFVVNGGTSAVDVLDLSDPTAPHLEFSIDVSKFGAVPNSLALSPTEPVLAVAVENEDKQAPGTVAFFDTDGNALSSVEVGALPDMVTFSPDGDTVLVANEGEPSDDYTIDPEGSISIIDVSSCAGHVTQNDVSTADFHAFDNANLDPSIRIFGPNASVSEDLEPEFIAVSPDSTTAWVTLQENNALAIVDIPERRVRALRGLGFRDHSRDGRGFDASDRDDEIRIQPWPTRGMYQPDAISVVPFYGIPFLITANEGDSRDYPGFSEETRVGDLILDPQAFPDAATLQADENLGRLKTTTALGDIDGDGDFDRIYSYGTRSFSVLSPWGNRIFDSRDSFEQITAVQFPENFNSTNDENQSFDNRSDDKGPEPEGVVVGEFTLDDDDDDETVQLAFIGLERVGGIMVYDVTIPWRPKFKAYFNNRDFSQTDPALAKDLGPEGLAFISADDSPTGTPLLAVANEVSGTTTIIGITVSETDD